MAGQAPAQSRGLIVHAAQQSFVDGMARGSLVCAGVVVLGAIFAFLVLPRRLSEVRVETGDAAAALDHATEVGPGKQVDPVAPVGLVLDAS